MDRRLAKTDRAIFEALQRLCESKPVSRIGVSELAREADITRKTFYSHFSNVSDAYSCFLSRLVDDIALRTEDDVRLVMASLVSLPPRDELELRLRLFLGNAGAFVEAGSELRVRRARHVTQEELFSYMFNPFLARVEEGLLGDPTRFAGREGLVAGFVLSGTIWALRQWLTGGCKESMVDVQDAVCEILVNGIGCFDGLSGVSN